MGYLGSKAGAGVFQVICALMPPHDTYVEPFVGSGAILRRKGPAFQSFVLDLDPATAMQHAAWPRTTALWGCGLAYLAAFDPRRQGRVLIYADPPYLHSTRSSSARYKHELTDEQHCELAGHLARLAAEGCAVIISGYPSDLYDQLYRGWNTREFQAMTRGGVRTEKVWFNFAPGAAHWSTFAGRNFTDRQRIKRKAERWATRFAALPDAERQAVLAAILAAEIPHSQT